MEGGEDVRLTGVVLALFMVVAMASNVFAIASGKTVEYASASAGKVIFDGKLHADAGAKCNDCHTKIFQMKKGSTKITMADMNAGKNCGVCHNGEKAFKSSDTANCAKCHKK
jgi:c(7)-type cytochrome triheme protein